MPVKAYFKGDGERILRLFVKKYGAKEGKARFEGVAHKFHVTPGDPNNSRPVKDKALSRKHRHGG